MGQKVNPHGLRVGVIKDWDSRWFARDNAFGDILFASTSTVPVPVSLSVRAARRLKSCALSARPW